MTQEQYNQNFDRELGWDDEITSDGAEPVSLTPGDYEFTVINLERGRHEPNPQKPGKLPACNKATLTLQIDTADGVATLKHNLFLHTSTEGMLSAFFGSIGQKKHGEPLRMNWNIIGAKGVCRVNKRKGTGQYADREYDNIQRMIYSDEVDWTKVLNHGVTGQPQQPTYQQSAQTSYQQPAGQTQQYSTQPQAPQQPAGFQAGMF